METIAKEPEVITEITLPYPSNLYDDKVTVKIIGQKGERSYEDRNVFLEFSRDIDSSMWVKGEDAIQLGAMLVKAGNFAMKANMYNHQLIHMSRDLDQFIKEGRVKKVLLIGVERNLDGYDSSHVLFKVVPQWRKGKAPQYQEDFEFERIISWSPFPKDFKKQKRRYFGKTPIKFISYDHDDTITRFNRLMEKQELTPPDACGVAVVCEPKKRKKRKKRRK